MHNPKKDKEPLDPHDLALCTCANLRKTTRVVTQFCDEALKPFGLTPGQFTILAVLSSRGPRRQAKLAEALAMDRTTLIRNLRPLEKKGLIAVTAEGRRGAKVLDITPAGEEIMRQAMPQWRRFQDRAVEALGNAGWGDLIRGLQATNEAFQGQ